ncbi:SCO family protein [Litorisediminicola beolgyonensis]|uniref:SCO family protein n=1 Tax=Litorisediminicola beolgyonensis TaxID=1173614 RepID=A0ABW3ZLP5_9RHOB
MRKLVLAGGAVAILGLSLGLWYTTGPGAGGDIFADCRSTRIAGGSGALGGPFTLTDQTGREVTEAQVFEEPALLYFGYTFCPDVCPLDVARNADAVDRLSEAGYEVTPVFISLDPKRDTPEVLTEFAAAMHPDMKALTGTTEQVDAAAKAWRVYYNVPESDDPYYLVDHTTLTYLVLPGHGFAEIFRRDATPEAIAETAACFIDAA